MTKVSVIIPAFNAEEFIVDALNSILVQSYKVEKQIIVIDDASSDDTLAVVSDVFRGHPQISCVPNYRKKGPSGARNTGLLKADGEYVAFLDADDVWSPNHLEEGIDFLEKNNNVDIVFFNFEIVDYVTKRHISDWFSERSFKEKLEFFGVSGGYKIICDDMFSALIDESFIHLQSMIIRKGVLKGILFDEGVKYSEDRDFSIKLFQISKARFAFKDVKTGVYFRHVDALTSKTIENDLQAATDHIKLFSKYLEDYDLNQQEISKINLLLYKRYLSSSYYYRVLHLYYFSLISLLKSLKYNISSRQLVEVVKIVVSSVGYYVSHRVERSK